MESTPKQLRSPVILIAVALAVFATMPARAIEWKQFETAVRGYPVMRDASGSRIADGDFVQWSRIFGAVAPEVAGIRRFGAASLDLAWVAAGRFDGYWESGLKPWDVAAGMLLVKEAGGYVTDFRGADRAMERNEFLAANDGLHVKLHKLVAGALR